MTQKQWQKLTEWPLTVAAVVFLVAYSWQVIVNPNGVDAVTVEAVIWVTWGIFVIDYVVNLTLSEQRWHWFYTHLFDLAVVVLPMLRPLRLLRLVTLLTVLNRTAGAAFRGRVIVYVVGAAGFLVYIAALAVLDAERGHGGDIQTFGEGLWWAFVTITTVGYGDYVPVTATGQLVAVGGMIGGISLIGVVTATLASWIVEKVGKQEQLEDALSREHIETLTEEVRALRAVMMVRNDSAA